MSGAEVLPLVEGGKGVAVSNGRSAGAWAAAGGIGTISGVNADLIDHNAEVVPLVYRGRNRRERHEELIGHSIKGAISQARLADEIRDGLGRIHMNVLWEMASCERVLKGVLEGARGLVHGVTCGAGMPYRLAEICAHYGVHYYPIVSSARAFNALWRRTYHRFVEWLGAVVYEDPWRAGGHNGLSNSEDPEVPQDPYPRVKELRDLMRRFGLGETPIVMAGGVWYLRDWKEWIDNPELGPIAFQFGTRPLLTQESPISEGWKQRLLKLVRGEVSLNPFSPTGFYSSAVNNNFLHELAERSRRQIPFADEPRPEEGLTEPIPYNERGRIVFIAVTDKPRVADWIEAGHSQPVKTPDMTLLFVSPEKAREIRRDQIDCMGCLSQCRFSNWATNERLSTGKPPDPRSYCIQKTLQAIAHGAPVDDQLMFAGHNVFKFRDDPFYKDGFVPSVRQLVERIRTGD
jgi:nitronate monooxygenase